MTSIRTIALAAGAILAMTAFEASAQSIRVLRCDAAGPGDTSLSVRYIERRTANGTIRRRVFSAEMEARAGGAIAAGHRMRVVVNNGSNTALRPLRPFEAAVGGDLVADLNLDSIPDGVDEFPFPANFPAVNAGDRVIAIDIDATPRFALGCRLR